MVRLQPSVIHSERESGNLGCVISQDQLILRRAEWKRNGKRVVFASGAFDLLHPGHVRLIEQARSHGDILVVGIESEANSRDQRDAQAGLPGPSVTPAAERAEIVAALGAVDFAVEFDPNSSAPFVARLAPDVVVLGGNPASDKKALSLNESSSAAGRVVRIPLEPGHSTARLIERIKNLNA
jgi:rfaE bifunctional protein nucleotidyltransferase chain/domain